MIIWRWIKLDLKFKNVFAIAIAMALIFSVVLAVSAQVNIETDGIHGHISDSHLEVDDNGNYNGYIKLDLTGVENCTDVDNLSDSELKSFKESLDHKNISGDLTVEDGKFVTFKSSSITSATLKDGILTIEFNGTDKDTKVGEFSGNIISMDSIGRTSNGTSFHIDGHSDVDASDNANSSDSSLDDKSADELLEENGWQKASEGSSAVKTGDGQVRVTSGSYVFGG